MQATERSSQQGEAADVGSTAGEGGGCVVVWDWDLVESDLYEV